VAQCEVCGNEYDKTFEVVMPGGDSHTFDCFGYATHALAPTCDNCGVRISGHGVEASSIYCCSHCAAKPGMAS
jgi:ribosome-binding protein aMBF1 (putative translation factor)